MLPVIILILLAIPLIWFLLNRRQFGRFPDSSRKQRMQASPNYKKGKFENLSYTPQLSEGYTMNKVLYNFLFVKHPNKRPLSHITSRKSDIKNLDRDSDLLIWFGHSSYFIQLEGKRFLIDPVFSGSASPIGGNIKAFPGSDIYAAEDMPEIDYLLISHDHYDHLDYKTIVKLKTKVHKVICGLGVGSHFEHWGYRPDQITELDWNDSLQLEVMKLHATPARHFSGRGLRRNNTLWLSYVLQSPRLNLFLGGDSGYDTHFKEIGDKYGPFDLAILENGQYDLQWKYIHMLPEEVMKAAEDLRAKEVLPVHSSKFALSNHPWNEPLNKIAENSKQYNISLITPVIGAVVRLPNNDQKFSKWWTEIS